MKILAREPVLTVGLITTAVVAILTLTDVFGLTDTTEEQRAAIVACIAALWPILIVIRQLVTPVASARLPDGARVSLPDGTPAKVVKE